MTIKMETMSELPDIKAEFKPDEFKNDEFGLNGGHSEAHSTEETSQPPSNDPNCQWVS